MNMMEGTLVQIRANAVVMATGGGFGAAVLVAILCLPISAPVAGAVFGAAAELFRTKP